MRPGVGYKLAPGSFVCSEEGNSSDQRCFIIDLTARPFGPDGTDRNNIDLAAKGRRYFGGTPYPSTRQGIGFEADHFEHNGGALENWYKEQSAEHKAEWNGIPNEEEKHDLAHRESRRNSAFYDRYWWNIIIITVDRGNYSIYRPLLLSEGITSVGFYFIENPLGVDVLYDVQWVPDEVIVEPPPEEENNLETRIEEYQNALVSLRNYLPDRPVWIRKVHNGVVQWGTETPIGGEPLFHRLLRRALEISRNF